VRGRSIIKGRKGVSPLFVSLYLAILTIAFISMLFFALEVSSASLTESSRIEQERMQESIALVGPEALELTEALEVERLRVNNTGSITVRIRALYIDHKFICDPSEFDGDAYIEPKECLWINLTSVDPPIILDGTTVMAYWTITTERGTKASEIGADLIWNGNGELPDPNKFYFGPLMLVFDWFHWRSGTGDWNSGWTIPKGTNDVTWQILVVNVDNRDIIIRDTSCFTLISNDNSPKDPVPWYIDPELCKTMTLKPNEYNFIYYTWNKPYSKSGRSAQDVNMREFTTNINFLTFYGSFVETDGTLTAFGQTIPFEAVLITDT
jgi:hypothetical protein